MQGASCSEKAGSHPHNKVGRERLYTDISRVYLSLKLWRDKYTELWLDDILQRKPIDKLDRDEVIAYLVMLMRSERHGSTRSADAAESGKTEAICMRLHETVK